MVEKDRILERKDEQLLQAEEQLTEKDALLVQKDNQLDQKDAILAQKDEQVATQLARQQQVSRFTRFMFVEQCNHAI